jgi:hypothetical protein
LLWLDTKWNYLGLLIAAASSSFNAKNQEVLLIAADVIRMDRLLRRYGPEAEGLHDPLRRSTAMKTEDLSFSANELNQCEAVRIRLLIIMKASQILDRRLPLEIKNDA